MHDIFVMNLDRHPQRLRFMKAQLDALGLPFHRVPSFDGRQPGALKNAVVAPYAGLAKGEVATFMTHRQAWIEIAERDLDCGIVMEDDIAIATDFASLEVPKEILGQADMIKFDFHPRASRCGTKVVPLTGTRNLRRLYGKENSGSCYLVTRSGAKKLIEKSKDYVLPIDLYLFDDVGPEFFNRRIWKVSPAAAIQLKWFLEEEALTDEVAESVQAQRRANVDPRPESLVRTTRQKLRLLTDWDFRWARERRIARVLSEIESKDPVEMWQAPYESDGRDHIDTALAQMDTAPA